MSQAAKSAMPAFPPTVDLEFDEMFSMALASLSTLSIKEMAEGAVQFLEMPLDVATHASKELLEQRLTEFATQLYNSKSAKLTEFEKYLDGAARQRLRNR